MSVKVASNRFIVSSLQKRVEFYQEILRNLSSFQSLGQRLIAQAEIAQDFRQVDKLEELSTILCNLPINEYQYIGQYYLAWCQYRKGENTSHIFEGVVEKSQTYKVKSLISLGALETARGDYATSLKHYAEAIRLANNPSMFVSAAKGLAILRSIEGDHKHALKSLQGLAPIARHTNAKVYNDYLNSFAVELVETGRIEDASNISKIVLASPYTFAYPEWRETGADIARRGYRSRSSIRVIRPFSEKIQNVLQLPERTSVSSQPNQPARVLNYLEWKEKMGKNGEDKIDPQKMSEREVLLKIIELSSGEEVTERELRQILDAIVKIRFKRD